MQDAVEHVYLFSGQVVCPAATLVDEVGSSVERRVIATDRHRDGVGRDPQTEAVRVGVRDDELPRGAVQGGVRCDPLVLCVVVLVLVA